MNKVTVFLCMVMFAATCYGGVSTVGTISSLRVHTNSHSNNTVIGHTTFNISASLAPPCTTLYVGPDEDIAVSFLLAAKAQNKEVKVYYHESIFSPWSSTTCSVYAVDIP